MKTKIMLILAFLGLTAAGASARDCSCKKKSHHHTGCQVTTVKKRSMPVSRTTTISTSTTSTTISQNLSALSSLPVSNRCVVGDNGEFSYLSENSWSGYYPGMSECAANPGLMPRFGSLVVSSPAFENNGALPTKYTCEGQQATPPLNVENIPDGTQSLAVMMYDPKATPSRSNTYWMVWNITSGSIPENFTTDHTSQNPYSKQYGYTAVCPVGGEHQYHFMVYALDKNLNLGRSTNRAMLEQAMSGHVLASGEIVGTYRRVMQ